MRRIRVIICKAVKQKHNSVACKASQRRIKMSEFTEFTASTPTVVAATEEKVFDKYWMSNLRIQAGDPTRPVRLTASWMPARDITIQVPTEVPVEEGIEGNTETVIVDVV